MKLDEKALEEILDNLEDVKKSLSKSHELREESQKSLKSAQEKIEALKGK